jgi:hypothetical protein
MKPWNLSPETTTGSSEMEAQDMTLYFELIRSLLEMPAGSNSQRTAVVRDDKAFALHVICTFPSSLPDNAIQAFSQRLQNDVDVCREALTHHWQCLQYMPFSIRGDPTLCQAAFESDPRALVWCHILEWKCDTARVQACCEKIQVDDNKKFLFVSVKVASTPYRANSNWDLLQSLAAFRNRTIEMVLSTMTSPFGACFDAIWYPGGLPILSLPTPCP